MYAALEINVAKVTDKVSDTSTKPETRKFLEAIQSRFFVGRVNIGDRFSFNEFEVYFNFHSTGSIIL